MSEETKPAPKEKKQSKPKPPPANMELRMLKNHQPFRIVFMDGKTITGKLVEMSQYNIVVQTAKAKLLVSKHAIKYYILEEKDGDEEAEAGTGK